MKVSSLPNLNRETTSFPNFFTLFQHPADHHHHDTALQIHEHSCDTEASETSPYKAILSPSVSLNETNEIGFLAGTSSVGVFRSESEHNDRTRPNSVSIGSNQFGGSEWPNLPSCGGTRATSPISQETIEQPFTQIKRTFTQIHNFQFLETKEATMTEAGTSKTSRSETPPPLPRFFTIGTSTWGADRLFFSPSNQAVGFLSPDFGFDISRNGKVLVPKKKRNGKAKLRWCMVRAVMKWGISVRRVVAARKWQDICEMRNEAMDPAETTFDLFDDEIVPEINSGPYCGGNSWAPGESLGPLMQIGHQTANDSFQIGTSTRGADRLFFSPSNQAVRIKMSVQI